MNTLNRLLLLVAALSLNVACAPPGAPYYHTQNGALMGATAGAVIGHQLDHENGAWVGGATGALLGGSIGNNMDLHDQGYRYDDHGYGSYPPPPHSYRRSRPDYYDRPYYRGYSD